MVLWLGNRVAPAWAGATRLPRGRQARPDLSAAKSGKKRKAVRMYEDIFSKRLCASAPMIATIRKYPGPIRQLSGGQLPGPLPAGASRRARGIGLGAVVGKAGRACLGWREKRACRRG